MKEVLISAVAAAGLLGLATSAHAVTATASNGDAFFDGVTLIDDGSDVVSINHNDIAADTSFTAKFAFDFDTDLLLPGVASQIAIQFVSGAPQFSDLELSISSTAGTLSSIMPMNPIDLLAVDTFSFELDPGDGIVDIVFDVKGTTNDFNVGQSGADYSLEVAAVPLPAPLFLLMAAAGGLALAARKKSA